MIPLICEREKERERERMDVAKVGKIEESISKCKSNPSIIHTPLLSSSPISKGINFAIFVYDCIQWYIDCILRGWGGWLRCQKEGMMSLSEKKWEWERKLELQCSMWGIEKESEGWKENLRGGGKILLFLQSFSNPIKSLIEGNPSKFMNFWIHIDLHGLHKNSLKF